MVEGVEEIQSWLEDKIGVNPNSLTETAWIKLINRRVLATSSPTFIDYFTLVLDDHKEQQLLIEEVVVPETWFFRDKDAFDFLQTYIRKENSYKRILSLPCSSGEEPYSVAIALDEMKISKDKFSIEAVDISQSALEKAKVAIYKKNSFRREFGRYKKDYFSEQEDGYHLDTKIRSSVKFMRGNILDKKLYQLPPYHIIMCRNLFIYLSKKAQESVFKLLTYILAPGGVIIVAPAEIELMRKFGYQSVGSINACAFSKKEGRDGR